MNIRKTVEILKYRIRLVLMWCSDAVALWRQSATPSDRNVLVLRVDHIGDFIVWLPSARALRKRFPRPEYRITLVANQQWAAWAADLDVFDDVWAVDRHKLERDRSYRTSFLRKLRHGGFGIALNPLYSREFSRGDLLIRAAGAPQSIGQRAEGTAPDRVFLPWGDRWYTMLVETPRQLTHELRRNNLLIRSLTTEACETGAPWVDVTDVALPEKLPQGPYVLISPGSSDGRRNWPVQRYVDVARRLREETGWSIVLCGGPGERALGEYVSRALGSDVVNLVGETTVTELSAVVKHAALVLTNDTGPAHFAAAQGVPCVAVVGGGHFGRFLPYPTEVANVARSRHASTHMECYGCGWFCKFSVQSGMTFPCIDKVSVKQVWDEVEASIGLVKSVSAPGTAKVSSERMPADWRNG